MSRPIKEGLDYFPHDINTGSDQKLEYIEALHGLIGYAVYFKLLEKIYRNGYYLPWNERDMVIFAKKNGIDIDVCKKVIDDCINEGLFDINVYNNYGILTSKGIQKRFLEASKRRKNVAIIKEYLLLNGNEIEQITENIVIKTLTPDNAAESNVNDENNSQRKEKKRKVK